MSFALWSSAGNSYYVADINRVLLPLALLFAVVSIARRRSALGGWLLYFYYWTFAFLFVSLTDIWLHPGVFMAPSKVDLMSHLALMMAVFPRLFAMCGVTAFALVLLRNRDWVWVERLRLSLLVAVIASAISFCLDLAYFPKSAAANGARLVGLFVWFLYFHMSKRIHHVFRTKDWGGQTST